MVCIINLFGNIICVIIKVVLKNFIEICSLVTTIIIAVVNYKFIKKQEEKDRRQEKINRIVNFQSVLILSDKIEFVLHMDSLHNYSVLLPYKNVLFKEEKTENGNTYALDMIIYLKNMSNIFPSEVCVNEIKFWNTSEDAKENFEQIYMNFINNDLSYKEVTINNNRETCFSTLCCCSKEDLEKLKVCEGENRLFNFEFDIAIKNSCRIINKCKVRGKFKLKDKQDLSSGNLGGTKEKLIFEIVESYLNLKEIKEENYE